MNVTGNLCENSLPITLRCLQTFVKKYVTSVEFIIIESQFAKIDECCYRQIVMTSHLEQQLAGLQLNHGDAPTSRKVGPAVPPKPKKPQPQVRY